MSRKRCIKLLISIGKDRNSASRIADNLSGIKRKMLCEAIKEFNAAYNSDIHDDQSLCRLQAATRRVIWLWRALVLSVMMPETLKYYIEFRAKALRGEIPVCREISMLLEQPMSEIFQSI